jgi:hypothetical protein
MKELQRARKRLQQVYWNLQRASTQSATLRLSRKHERTIACVVQAQESIDQEVRCLEQEVSRGQG